MAKHSVRDVPGRVKFRVIEFELDGSDVALQDAIKGLSNALSGNRGPSQVKRITSGNGHTAGVIEDAAEPEVNDETPEEETPAAPEPRATRSRAKQVARPPKIVDSLEFAAGDTPLKTFIEQKKPTSTNKKYLVIAYWLKQYRQVTSVGADHIYTAFRFLGWNVPARPDKPLWNLKGAGWLTQGAQTGEFTINHIGEGVVNDMGSK